MSLFISYYNMKITKREGEYIRKYMNLLIFSFVKSSILILLFLYFFLFLFLSSELQIIEECHQF